MQKEWHRHHSSPPAYQPTDLPPVSPIEQLPSYHRASRSCSALPVYIQRQISHTETIIDLYSFPPRSTILVIGAYTRQGMHIIDRLIENGHQVRGIVSNTREAAQISKHFEASHGRGHYRSGIFTDMSVEGALDSTAQACSGVIFVSPQASPVASSNEAHLANVINALFSAMKATNMDRFIYCSPAPAARPLNEIFTIDEDAADSDSTSIQAPPRPSRWLSQNGRPRGGKKPEETPVELAIERWADHWEPRFALQTGMPLHIWIRPSPQESH